jgi:hypothetical protein
MIEKAHASCLGASYLLLVVGLHVVVGSTMLVVVVDGGSWLQGSII